ncbi:MAG: hypothetical protein ABW186_09565 [Rhodanobacteraceae bacterium]
MKLRVLALSSLAVALAASAHAGVIDKAQREGQAALSSQTWSAWGGELGVRWNSDLLSNIGIEVAAPTAKLDQPNVRGHEWFAMREAAGLQFTVRNGALRNFVGGSLQMRGGYVLRLRDGSTIDLRDLAFRVRTDNSNILDVFGSDGRAWFYTDRLMFELDNGGRTLAVRAADLRISPALANRIGVPEASGWEVADLAMNTSIYVEGADLAPDRVCNPYPWPGVAVPSAPTSTYQADLFMVGTQYSPVGCQNCDGSGGNDGLVSIAPSSSLENNVNDGSAQATVPNDPLGTSTALYTANVAWYSKFSGSNAPYNNDQHPFLIWNMYRFNADGSIDQIGRSGVKHAFLTINASCLDSCNDSHSLGRGCGDTYGTGNNDSPWDMGPRSEIVPASATWGRCGSIFDPNCTGGYAVDDGNNDSWTQRLKTHESQVDPAVNSGATYMMESWYIAKDDINIYNSMATVTGVPHYASNQWSLTGQTSFKLGPAIDKWVSPTAPPANSLNTELAAGEGHAKVAVKATDLGGGNWRYVYAVENLDFARAITQPPANGSDPRVVSNKGFDSFSVPLPAGSTVVSTAFSDGDLVASNNWSAVSNASSVTWRSSGGPVISPNVKRQTLDWGTLFTFTVVVNKAPTNGSGTLHVATAGAPASYAVASLVPGS